MNEKLLHDLIVDYLKQKLSNEYNEVKTNPEGTPDLTLSNHGLILAMLEVETEHTITAEKAEKWKEMAESGTKLILMVPKNSKIRVTELLWQIGIADKISVGSYDIVINMP
ncbi:hypothetical protein JZK55_02450 [Dissulfurispira thermophila]|uniref:Uncharacterized protein n=1 Tax=Dissulfurispira thermophila TaxID=2715679 RepID=A0A7G1GZG6_9BACT|nr:hypothetical protein [Dissulfurispira thermophila]BCB95323.1 hypothetical protein JZK55_02450 [Dissulfurispira thermophila]